MLDRYDPRGNDSDRCNLWDRDLGGRGSASDRNRNDERESARRVHAETSTCRVDVSAGPFGSVTASTRSTAPRAARWRPSARFGSSPRAISTTSATTPRARGEASSISRSEGLIRTSPLSSDDRAVTLTDRGRDLLEANRYERHDRTHEPRQTFHAGIRKPRELTHDTKVYRAYQRAEERLRGQGGRVRRVVLDYELKRDYQRFLHERNRGKKDCDGRPDREPEEIARWAREHELPYDDGHVRFPDARIEYEDRDGRSRHEDLEVVTGHYRGAHAGSAAKSGFTCYLSIGCSVGGRGGGGRRTAHPRIIEELLR